MFILQYNKINKLLDDIGIDLPEAPNNFGEVLGNVVVVGGLDFTVIKEIPTKVEDEWFRKSIFGAAIGSINLCPSGQELLANATDWRAGLWKFASLVPDCFLVIFPSAIQETNQLPIFTSHVSEKLCSEFWFMFDGRENKICVLAI